MLKRFLLVFTLFPVLAFGTTVKLIPNDRSTIDVPVQISGAAQPANFLFDTGSGYTVLPGVPVDGVYTKDIEGVMANGQRITTKVYTLPSIKVGDCLIRDVEVIAFDTTKRPILGMNVLKQFKQLTMDFDTNSVTFVCPTEK